MMAADSPEATPERGWGQGAAKAGLDRRRVENRIKRAAATQLSRAAAPRAGFLGDMDALSVLDLVPVRSWGRRRELHTLFPGVYRS